MKEKVEEAKAMCNCCAHSPVENKVFTVQGMTCNHCKMALEKAVASIAGVEKVEVDLTLKTVSVNYRPDKVDPTQIIAVIEDQGYDVVK